MHKALHPSSMVPPGFAVVSASTGADGTTILVRSTLRENHCPSCGTLSSWVHSRYCRRIGDLPLAAFAAKPLDVGRAFSPNALPTVFLPLGHGVPVALMVSFIILVSP